jgi:hypothetical protein
MVSLRGTTRIAVPLLALLLSTGAAGAAEATTAAYAPAAPGAHARAADIDTDGDGVPDSGDGCPKVAAATSTGCPTASRSASLRWLAGKHRLQLRVTSGVSACSSRARFVLWRVRRHADFKQLGGNVSYAGRARLKVPRGSRYYVTVAPSYSPGVAECAKATTRTVRVP